MGYTKTVWKDRAVEYPRRYKDQNNNQLILTRDPGTITEAGTAVSATAMNNIEQGIVDIHELYTASDVLTKLKTVDGSGSGLDADLVRGLTFRLDSGVFQYSTDGGTTWVNAGGVKSVQTGVYTLVVGPSGLTGPFNIAISEVASISKASVHLVNIFGIGIGAYSASAVADFRACLTSTANLQINGSAGETNSAFTINLQWEVIEYY